MILERIQEYQALRDLINDFDPHHNKSGIVYDSAGYGYDLDLILDRYNELAKDFLAPYVVSKPSKEE